MKSQEANVVNVYISTQYANQIDDIGCNVGSA